MNSPLPNIAIIGMGGFAIQHHRAAHQLEAGGKLRLLATCDPSPERRSSLSRFELEERGVLIFDSLEKTLQECGSTLDFVAISTPIEFHAPMHKACVDAGVACYLEKPPILHWGEYQKMLAAEAESKIPTIVGFNFQTDPVRLMLRNRVERGEFGELRQVRFHGQWPRSKSYFNRNNWAGRIWNRGYPVMDSVTGNAMAHYVQNTFHWAGAAEGNSIARLHSLESKLWRANDIESYDSVLARVETEGGIEIRIAATHAVAGQNTNLEIVICDEAKILFDVYNGYKIIKNGRVSEEGNFLSNDALSRNYLEYLSCIREGLEPCNTLAGCESFLLFNGLSLISSEGIGCLESLQKQIRDGDDTINYCPDFVPMAKYFLNEGEFPDGGVASARKERADIDALDDVLGGLRMDETATA